MAARSASEVWAVGNYTDVYNQLDTLIQLWNGYQWQVASSPNPGLTNALYGVAVRSDGDAWAVGYYVLNDVTYPLILRLVNGTWQQNTNIDNVPSGTLSAVTTINSNDAWAVGTYSQGCTIGFCALTLHWDGTQWHRIVTPPISPYSSQHTLEGVATAGGDIWAVGRQYRYDPYYTRSYFVTLTLHWTNGNWTYVSSPNGSNQGTNSLHGIAMSASGNGHAVGNWLTYGGPVQESTLALGLQGSSWSLAPSSNPTSFNYLYSVAYAQSNDAWAVGQQGSTVPYQTLIERWNGSQWDTVTSPNQPGGNILRGVAAVAADDVWAVGSYAPPSSPERTLIMHYSSGATPTPTATVTSTPTPTPTIACSNYWCISPSQNVGTGSNAFYAVSARADNDVWAVGSYNSETSALVEHWDGANWTTIPIPSPQSVGPLSGIALAGNDVWVTGNGGTLRYHNAVWTQLSGVQGARAVTATGANDVWLVGSAIWHWTGGPGLQQYSLQAGDFLNGVSAIANNDAWAVGYTTNTPSGTRQSLTMRWTGGPDWSRSVLTNPPTGVEATLNAVTYTNAAPATTLKWVWAVGSYVDDHGVERTLAEFWQNNTWRIVSVPDFSDTVSRLYGVWSNQGGEWAVGTYNDSLPPPCCNQPSQEDYPSFAHQGWKTILLRWDTTSWTPVNNPIPGAGNEFIAVSAVSTSAWAVGSYVDGTSNIVHTLVEDITAPIAPRNVVATKSYYMASIEYNDCYNLGKAAGLRHENGIIVLDFGQPWYQGDANPVYGANYFKPDANNEPIFAPIHDPADSNRSDIAKAAKAFADGFIKGYGPPGPSAIVTITLGINNSGSHRGLIPEHAQAWADLVDEIYQYVAAAGYIDIAGAIDAEPGFDQYYTDSNSWATAFSQHAFYDYYDFGSADAFPGLSYGVCDPRVLPTLVCSPWSAGQQFHIAQELNGAHPLPEIYILRFAREWYRVNRLAIEKGTAMAFMGAMNNCAEGDCSGGDPYHLRNPESWRAFWLELNADPETHQDVPWSTDIGCSNGSHQPLCGP